MLGLFSADTASPAGSDLILSGVSIGDGVVVGARSVVTKDLASYSICVRTLCEEVKQQFNDECIKFLLELKWWDWTGEKIKKIKLFLLLI